MIQIFLAEELVGQPYREIFLERFWKMIDEGKYGLINWDYVKSQHANGVFMSKIVTYKYTIPYLYAIAVLIALRKLIPNRSRKEIDQEIAILAIIFQGLSWGHGIERPVEARRIVKWLAAAGAFPIHTEKGSLEIINPIYQKLLKISQEPNGFSNRKEPIFQMEILLNIIKEKDIPSKKYPKEFLEKTRKRTPAIFWIIDREINGDELLSAFHNR
ncbi:MAG: hypothetical protein GF308_06040 [Candidatus Heimdallarchaeota archaeon]|nr:hypothetical protein [Candidatus Heimdallarchaeota archaeon]